MKTFLIAGAAAAAVFVPATVAVGDGTHGMPMATHAAPSGMTVALRVTADAKAGHNLRITTRKFRWAPEHASGKHRQGEGHAHLYVDGKKVTRLYGAWYYLGDLAKGRHTIRVTLNGNDHGDYVRNGKPVGASRTVTVK